MLIKFFFLDGMTIFELSSTDDGAVWGVFFFKCRLPIRPKLRLLYECAPMAKIMEQQKLMTQKEAEAAIRNFLTRMYDDSQRNSGY